MSSDVSGVSNLSAASSFDNTVVSGNLVLGFSMTGAVISEGGGCGTLCNLDLDGVAAGAFDLIISDEAHRSVYDKLGSVFEYFDAKLIGITATPADYVDHYTYTTFGCEKNVPTFNFDFCKFDKFILLLRIAFCLSIIS